MKVNQAAAINEARNTHKDQRVKSNIPVALPAMNTMARTETKKHDIIRDEMKATRGMWVLYVSCLSFGVVVVNSALTPKQ